MGNRILGTFVGGIIVATAPAIFAADHADTPFLNNAGRTDALLTDLHAFTRGDNLVLIVATNPAVPLGATSYVFPEDMAIHINIDNSSAVSSDDPNGLGGTILEPDKIRKDHSIRITFRGDGPTADVKSGGAKITNFFAGPRDDPFIRGPRIGRNVAAVVLEVPLADVTANQSTILVWAEVELEDLGMVELGARALRSMFPENHCLNNFPPSEHADGCGMVADAMIYDTAAPAAYPNGRELADDVVDLVGDPRVLGNDAPFPSENDKPFLAVFPYLASPH